MAGSGARSNEPQASDTDGVAAVAGFLLVALAGGCALLAVNVAREALSGSRYVHWSDDPGVWLGELVLAGAAAALGVVAIAFTARRFGTGAAGRADTFAWIGLGFVGAGILSVAVGWLGLHVPTTPGYDVLSRGEPMFIIYGAVVGAFGVLVTLVAAVAASLRPPVEGGGDRARPSLNWMAADAPAWRLVHAGVLKGPAPGDLLVMGVGAGSVTVA
jgi:hypothetical protein